MATVPKLKLKRPKQMKIVNTRVPKPKMRKVTGKVTTKQKV
jgi:hypothetical protein